MKQKCNSVNQGERVNPLQLCTGTVCPPSSYRTWCPMAQCSIHISISRHTQVPRSPFRFSAFFGMWISVPGIAPGNARTVLAHPRMSNPTSSPASDSPSHAARTSILKTHRAPPNRVPTGGVLAGCARGCHGTCRMAKLPVGIQ